jgi:hypothetical protein
MIGKWRVREDRCEPLSATLDIACFLQPLAERDHEVRGVSATRLPSRREA